MNEQELCNIENADWNPEVKAVIERLASALREAWKDLKPRLITGSTGTDAYNMSVTDVRQ